MPATQSIKALIADIGGTNARFAITDINNRLVVNRTLLVRDYETVELAIDEFLSQCGYKTPRIFALALACPVSSEIIRLTNSHWTINKTEMIKQFQLQQLLVINDFAALAYAVPQLNADQVRKIGGTPQKGNIAVVGPGTGLGVSGIIFRDDSYTVIESEGGHVSFAPDNEQEDRLLHHIWKRYPRASAERLLQGQGLLTIYQSLCKMDNTIPTVYRPEQISEKAINGVCEYCHQALSTYCAILGSFTGNLVLTFGALGGAYMGGGIIRNFEDFLINSEFRQRFEDKGRFSHYMTNIPTYIITAEMPAFNGIIKALDQQLP